MIRGEKKTLDMQFWNTKAAMVYSYYHKSVNIVTVLCRESKIKTVLNQINMVRNNWIFCLK